MKQKIQMKVSRKIMMKMHGFTLVELLMTIAIAGLIVSVAIPNYECVKEREFDVLAKTNLFKIYMKEGNYFMNNSYFTDSLGSLSLDLSTKTVSKSEKHSDKGKHIGEENHEYEKKEHKSKTTTIYTDNYYKYNIIPVEAYSKGKLKKFLCLASFTGSASTSCFNKTWMVDENGNIYPGKLYAIGKKKDKKKGKKEKEEKEEDKDKDKKKKEHEDEGKHKGHEHSKNKKDDDSQKDKKSDKDKHHNDDEKDD